MTQVITTRKGVRTHVGAVMGGSSTTDLGTYIQEDPSYFDYLNTVYGAGWDKKMLQTVSRELVPREAQSVRCRSTVELSRNRS